MAYIKPPPGTGKYDDTHSGWTYTGTWGTYTGPGPYTNTFHYSSVVGSSATFTFDGTLFNLIYSERSSRGEMDVFVDNIFKATINANNPVATWQKTWSLPSALSAGYHTVKVVHKSGSFIDIDAIEISGALDSTPPAAIDDLQAVTGTSMGSVDLSWTAVGDNGTIGIATSYLVKYRTDTAITSANWDDTNTKSVTTGIPSPQTSGQMETMTVYGLTPGQTYYFAVRAQDEVPNTGAVSTITNNSSAVAFNPPPPANDDFNNAVDFSNEPMPYTDTKEYFYAATTEDTTEPIDPQIVQCNSDEGTYSIWYAYTPESNGILIADTYGTNLAYDTVMAVWTFDGNTFTHVACNDDANESTYMSEVVAYMYKNTTYYIEVVQYTNPPQSSPSAAAQSPENPIDEVVLNANFSPAPLRSSGKYDDTDNGWVYSSNWATWTGTGPYNNTFHYSNVVGSSAAFAFSGTTFDLIYSERSSRGEMDIFVDGSFIATINANNPVASWQKTWSLPSALNSGNHVIKVVHKSGAIIDIDAINVNPGGPPSTGKYDDTDPRWTYAGTWATYTGTGPYNNTFHYSSLIGSSASFTFEGPLFELTYSERSSRGQMEIFIDNNPIATINANNPIATWQQTWRPPSALSPGLHTLKVVHNTGDFIDIDAIEIINPPGIGKYDDTHSGWKYTGSWATWTGTGPYNDTFHYSSVFGSFATFDFEGTMFKLTYSERSSRGEMDIFVDNNFVTTINANNPIATWQKTWSLPSALSAGYHTVKVVHKSGSFIDIDAIEITAP